MQLKIWNVSWFIQNGISTPNSLKEKNKWHCIVTIYNPEKTKQKKKPFS